MTYNQPEKGSIFLGINGNDNGKKIASKGRRSNEMVFQTLSSDIAQANKYKMQRTKRKKAQRSDKDFNWNLWIPPPNTILLSFFFMHP